MKVTRPNGYTPGAALAASVPAFLGAWVLRGEGVKR